MMRALPSSLQWRIALCHEQKGDLKQATAELERAVALSGEGTLSLALLVNAYAAAGQPARAMKMLDELKARLLHRYVSPVDMAVICSGRRP